MRPLKFRAWSKESHRLGLVENIWWWMKAGKLFVNAIEIHFEDNSTEQLYASRSPKELEDPFILEQFTGLHDKNGNEIYEGDLVSFRCRHNVSHWWSLHDGQIGEIQFADGRFGIFTEEEWENITDCEWINVVSNIHEPQGVKK